MRTTFTDKLLQKKLDKSGFVVVDLLNQAEIDTLQKYYSDHRLTSEGHNFFTTIWLKDPQYRRNINSIIQQVILPKISPLVENHKAVFANYMVKMNGEKSAIGLHQDWTFLDESKFRAINVWIPLVDTDAVNGALQIVPYSHRIFTHIRGRNIDSPLEAELFPWLKENHLESLPVKAGQAIIFDAKMIHASEDNRSDQERVAVSLVLAPSEAKLQHYYKTESNTSKIRKAEVEPDFFVDFGYFDDLSELAFLESIEDVTVNYPKAKVKWQLFKEKIF